jgi:serine/threonine protein kinase
MNCKDDYYKNHTIVRYYPSKGAEVSSISFNSYSEGSSYPREAILKKVLKTEGGEKEKINTANSGKCSNIFIKLYHYQSYDNYLYLFLEFCKNGTVEALIQKKINHNVKFNLIYILFQFRNLSHALTILHSKKMAHRDIKPSNIFINLKNSFKIGDFGELKNNIESGNTTIKGTENYMPEYIKNKLKNSNNIRMMPGHHHAYKIDIYGFSKTFLECLLLSNSQKYSSTTENRDEAIINDLSLNGLGEDYSGFIIESMREYDDNLEISMEKIYYQLNELLIKETKKLTRNEFICYLCEESVYSESFLTLTGECIYHPVHIECYQEFLSNDPRCNKCPLCGVDLNDQDIESLR